MDRIDKIIADAKTIGMTQLANELISEIQKGNLSLNPIQSIKLQQWVFNYVKNHQEALKLIKKKEKKKKTYFLI